MNLPRRLVVDPLLFIHILFIFSCGPNSRSLGDGELWDHGWRSIYPRFEIQLPPTCLRDDFARSYLLTGVPHELYDLQLRVSDERRHGKMVSLDQWREMWEYLYEAHVVVKIEFATSLPGETKESAHTGFLASGWSPGAMGGVRYFSSPDVSAMRLGEEVRVQIEISTSNFSNAVSHLCLSPTLVGGGFEK